MRSVDPRESQAVPATSSNDGSAQASVSFDVSINRPSKPVFSESSSPRFDAAEREALPRASRSISRSRLWIALWLSDVTPTRFPSRISATAIRAPCHVLPEPGGPCTKR